MINNSPDFTQPERSEILHTLTRNLRIDVAMVGWPGNEFWKFNSTKQSMDLD